MSENILVVAAHPDDEILGLGGTIARHISQKDEVLVSIIADAGTARYQDEKIAHVRQCCMKAAHSLGVSDIRFGGLEDQKLDILPILEITQWVEAILKDFKPDIIYTHHRGDINRDHQIVHEATLTAARPYAAPYVKRILCYEAPSATEWNGPYLESAFIPNVFINISDYMEAKIKAMAEYHTELSAFPHPRSPEALRARAVLWGSVIGVKAAEPFILVREIQK